MGSAAIAPAIWGCAVSRPQPARSLSACVPISEEGHPGPAWQHARGTSPPVPGTPLPPPQGPAYASGRPAPRGAPQTPGLDCWRCGQPSHFRRECPLMEVGQLVRVAGPPVASPDLEGTYRIPVCIQGGTHQALMDTGCNQTMIHQRLVRPGALVEASWVKVRCVHFQYPEVALDISFRGKKHRVRAGVSTRLTDLGDKLAGVC